MKNLLQGFFTKSKPLFYKKGDMVINPEEKSHLIFYIKNGYVQAQSMSEDGKELILYVAGPGSCVPIIPLLANKKNEYYWKAISPVEAYKWPFEKTVKFLKRNPSLLLDLFSNSANVTYEITKRMESLVFNSAQDRIKAIFPYLVKHYGKRRGNQTVIKHRLTHHELAAWTGLNRETVSRKMKLLEKSGFISYKNRETIIVI